MPKLLAISHSTFDPASRFRVTQLLPHFRAAGWSTTHRPLWPSLYWRAPLRPGRVEFAARIAGDALRRITTTATCRRADRYDVVLVNRELPVGADLLLQRNSRLIFDFDDAIHLGLMGEHVATMCRGAACTVVGNALLADAARAYASRVEIIPTLVDTASYKVKSPAAAPAVVRVAWLGSDLSIRETLLPHLDILAEAQKMVPFRLVVISRPRPPISHRTLDWSFVEWTPAVERGIADHAEIGIMPLQDTPFQRAKCGLKLLEYMAAGLPAIVSPVGVSADIARASEAARLASSADEWTAALAEFVGAASLRAQLGARGRAYCEAHYSIAAWLPRWLAILQDVARGPINPSPAAPSR